MNTESLKTFLTLAELESFTRTAQYHNVVQSTVTARIKELENELGVPLFIRDRKNVSLTDRGNQLYSYAKQIVELEKKAKLELHAERVYQEQLRLGMSHTLYPCHLEGLVMEYLTQHGGVSIDVKLSDSMQALMNLSDDAIDLCFAYSTFTSSQILSFPFRSERLILVTSHKNREKLGGVTLSELERLPIIVSFYSVSDPPAWYVDWSQEYCRFAFRTNAGQNVIPMLKASGYYSVLPQSMVSRELDKGSIVEIPLLDAELPILRSHALVKEKTLEKRYVRDFLCACFRECEPAEFSRALDKYR